MPRRAPSRGMEATVSPLNWAIPQTRSVLMIPGPTEIPHPVIQAMNQPPSTQYGQSLRIGTMGITASPLYVLPTLSALELALRDLGARGEPGTGVAAAQAVFADAA